MLTLHYDGESARINDNGSVEYREGRDGLLVVTVAPSSTIMQLVQAAIPIISPEMMRAKMGITRIEEELKAVMVTVRLAENAECAAQRSRREALDKKSDLSAQLEIAKSALRVLQPE